MLPAGRHPARSGHTTHGSGDPAVASRGSRQFPLLWPRRTGRAGVLALWRRHRLRCRSVERGCWVLRPCPDAYLRTRPQPKQGPFPRPAFAGFTGRRVAFPSVLRTPRTPARHVPLSPSAYTDRLRPTWPPGRASPVPHRTPVRMPSSLPRGRPAPLRSGPGAVCCLRREMSGSAGPTFRVFLSRGCKVRVMLGLRTCSPPARPMTRGGLLTPHSDGGISSRARGLLRGAPALTAAGLAPASSMQHEPPRNSEAARSGRTIGGECTAPPPAAR